MDQRSPVWIKKDNVITAIKTAHMVYNQQRSPEVWRKFLTLILVYPNRARVRGAMLHIPANGEERKLTKWRAEVGWTSEARGQNICWCGMMKSIILQGAGGRVNWLMELGQSRPQQRLQSARLHPPLAPVFTEKSGSGTWFNELALMWNSEVQNVTQRR